MRRLIIPISLIVALYLDSVIFPELNILGTRPDMVLAVIASLSMLTGSVTGGIIGLCAGLFSDVFFGKLIGLHALTYMASGICAGFFFEKFYADNLVIAPACAACCSFLKEHVMALVIWLLGGNFLYGNMLITYIIPCALLTGVLCMLVHIIAKPMMSRQVKQRVDYRVGG